MKGITIKRKIKESLQNLNRNKKSTITSVVLMSFTLFMIMIFQLTVSNISHVADVTAKNIGINTYLKNGLDDGQRGLLKSEIEKMPDVKSVKFQSKDEELSNLTKVYGKEFDMLSGESNPLYDTFLVKLKDEKELDSVTKKIEKLDGVEHAKYGKDVSKQIIKFSNKVTLWGTLLAIGLSILSIFVASLHIKSAIDTRSLEIETMKLVGGTSASIRLQFIFEGMIIGLISGIFASTLSSIIYTSVSSQLNPQIKEFGYTLLSPGTTLIKGSLIILILGLMLGSLASALSMRKSLKI